MGDIQELHATDEHLPLIIDLDGSLISTDLLLESLMKVLRTRPYLLFLLPFWLLKGRAFLKAKLAERCKIDAAALPYNEQVLALIEREKKLGRKICLVTASTEQFANQIADHLGLFDEVFGSRDDHNLKGARKASFLVQRFGKGRFDYTGDSRADIAVWKEAAKVYVVTGSLSFFKRIEHQFPGAELITAPKLTPYIVIRQMRVHQWVKNLLIFVPPIMAHNLLELPVVFSAIAAFFSFSFCASGVYIINDLVDLEADRQHHYKRHRPLASGTLPLHMGASMVPFLWGTSLLLALFLPVSFLLVLGSYLLITTLYSFLLKRIEVLDVVTLAGLYTVRVLAGGMACSVVVSPWLLAFSLFMFLSLGCVKRYSELFVMRQKEQEITHGRGYRASDLEMIGQCGISSGYISVLVLALYINSDVVIHFYRYPEVLWMLCPVILFWITRVWLLAHRGELHEDPIVFALHDVVSFIVAGLSMVITLLAL